MTNNVNVNNTVVGYFGDDMTIVEMEDGELMYALVPEGLYPIGTTISEDRLFSVRSLPITHQQKIQEIIQGVK